MISILFIAAYIILFGIIVVCSAYIVFGFSQPFNDGDYCVMYNDSYVEYCIVPPNSIDCDTPEEQLLCRELAKENKS